MYYFRDFVPLGTKCDAIFVDVAYLTARKTKICPRFYQHLVPNGTFSTRYSHNLQAIIALGFKINNERAVQFRKWANAIVKDYTIQGWVMDVERLKNGGTILNNNLFESDYDRFLQLENEVKQIRDD